MPIQFISPKKAVNSAFLKLPVSVENMERFRLSLANLYKKRDAARDEEYHKGEICNKRFKSQDQIGYYKEFEKQKNLYPNITLVFPFIYDVAGSVCNDKAFVVKKNGEGCLIKSLLAILNSSLAKLWIWYNCPELMGGTREIRKVYFENFRIPLDKPEIFQQLAVLTDEIIATKKQASCHPERTLEPKAIGEVEGSCEALQKQITDLETQVNTLVYQLYGITDAEEIEAVEKNS